MPHHLQGRPVGSMEEIDQPGDYYANVAEDGRVSSLWFSLPGFPSHKWNRINGPAADLEPRWEITVEADGVVHVEPSIRTRWNEGETERVFHAFLHHGVWEVLDDSIGARFE